jgi:hypothetical protein
MSISRWSQDTERYRLKRLRSMDNRAGSALVGTILLTIVLSTLATVSLNVAIHEIEATNASREELSAQNLAESAAEVVLAWFHDPRATPDGPARSLFSGLSDDGEGGPPSFFDQNGVSRFTGTSEEPNVILDAAHPEDDRLLNDPQQGWFHSLAPLGRVLKLKVYGPARPGLLCTIEAMARSGGVSRTVSVELGARSIPPLRSGVLLRMNDPNGLPRSDAPLPVRLHWGDLTARGDLNLGLRAEIPMKTDLAPTGDQSYADMQAPEDRWLDFWLGGNARMDSHVVDPSRLPMHVHSNREPSPGLEGHQWNYETMKRQALLYGSYYVPDATGLLRLNGMIDATALTPTEVFRSTSVGEHHGLIFIDTLDQRPPNPANLSTLTVEAEYSEGLFIVNGHLHWKPRGHGKSVPALSPPPETSSSIGLRIPSQLSGIHLQGVLSVAGNLLYDGVPRVYGALVVEGDIVMALPSSAPLEVWYNYDLRAGLMRGLPLVYVAHGTRQEKY